FGPFRLDVRNARLTRNDQPIALPPKTFEVLRLLVSRAGQLVEKDVLMREVWRDTFVEEANVSRHIWALRKTLGDNESDERYIETVPKRGYRFAADVRAVAPDAHLPAAPVGPSTDVTPVRASRSVLVAAAGAVLAVGVAVWAFGARR